MSEVTQNLVCPFCGADAKFTGGYDRTGLRNHILTGCAEFDREAREWREECRNVAIARRTAMDQAFGKPRGIGDLGLS